MRALTRTNARSLERAEPFFDFHWNDELGQHLEEHDVTPEDFEEIVCHPLSDDTSDSSGRPVVFGYTSDGRFVMAVYAG